MSKAVALFFSDYRFLFVFICICLMYQEMQCQNSICISAINFLEILLQVVSQDNNSKVYLVIFSMSW